jgi:hypothetical protein
VKPVFCLVKVKLILILLLFCRESAAGRLDTNACMLKMWPKGDDLSHSADAVTGSSLHFRLFMFLGRSPWGVVPLMFMSSLTEIIEL